MHQKAVYSSQKAAWRATRILLLRLPSLLHDRVGVHGGHLSSETTFPLGVTVAPEQLPEGLLLRLPRVGGCRRGTPAYTEGVTAAPEQLPEGLLLRLP